MALNARIYSFPSQPDREFARRAQKAIRGLITGERETGPLVLYGPHANSVSLVLWASACREKLAPPPRSVFER